MQALLSSPNGRAAQQKSNPSGSVLFYFSSPRRDPFCSYCHIISVVNKNDPFISTTSSHIPHPADSHTSSRGGIWMGRDTCHSQFSTEPFFFHHFFDTLRTGFLGYGVPECRDKESPIVSLFLWLEIFFIIYLARPSRILSPSDMGSYQSRQASQASEWSGKLRYNSGGARASGRILGRRTTGKRSGGGGVAREGRILRLEIFWNDEMTDMNLTMGRARGVPDAEKEKGKKSGKREPIGLGRVDTGRNGIWDGDGDGETAVYLLPTLHRALNLKQVCLRVGAVLLRFPMFNILDGMSRLVHQSTCHGSCVCIQVMYCRITTDMVEDQLLWSPRGTAEQTNTPPPSQLA